jgi:predicted small secreted protein
MFRFITILILFSIAVLSADFTGTGFGKDIKEAKHEALADLSQSIKAEVRSSFITYKAQHGNKTDSDAASRIIVSSNLPIIGAEFELFDNSDNVEALVALSPKKVKRLYADKLNNLSKEIYTLQDKIKQSKDNLIKEELLAKILQKLNEFERYYSVGIIVGVNGVKRVDITRASIENELLNIHHNLDSIGLAARYLAKTFKNYSDIYLYPPKVKNSHEITPFAKAFSLHVKPYIHTTTSLKKAKYRLIGEYTYSKNALILSYDLISSKTHESMASKTVTLDAKAYKEYRVVPKNISFDKLLHDGVVISSSLKASLSTNKGTEDLLFFKGEEIELLIKFNKMAYYYIIGYTQTEDTKQAYLLELNEGVGDARFLGFVNADDANHWISIGTFIVEPPFGIESIQLIASNTEITTLVKHYYDKKSGYYLIGKNPKEGLAKTRGLIRKKSKKQEISEAVLLFSTAP